MIHDAAPSTAPPAAPAGPRLTVKVFRGLALLARGWRDGEVELTSAESGDADAALRWIDGQAVKRGGTKPRRGRGAGGHRTIRPAPLFGGANG